MVYEHTTLLTSLSTMKRCPKWTMQSRDTIKGMSKSNSVPGPGAYGAPKNDRFDKAPMATLGSGEREPTFTSMKKPGPTAYDPQINAVMALGPRWSMGTAERKSMARKTSAPGPGAYVIPNSLSRVSAPMIARRADPAESKKRSSTPGPGKYDQDRSLNGCAWKMGTSERKSMARVTAAPGPGNYPVPTCIGKSHPQKANAPAFTLRSRKNPFENKKGPGPGEHGLYTTFG